MPKLAGASKYTRTRKREFVAADLKVLNALVQLWNQRNPDLNTRDAIEKLLRTIQPLGEGAVEEPLTLTVMGHQVVRRPEAYGLLPSHARAWRSCIFFTSGDSAEANHRFNVPGILGTATADTSSRRNGRAKGWVIGGFAAKLAPRNRNRTDHCAGTDIPGQQKLYGYLLCL
jgi:hypothetical protein